MYAGASAAPGLEGAASFSLAAGPAADVFVGLTHAGTGAALGLEGIASPSLAAGLAGHPLTGSGALEAGLAPPPTAVRSVVALPAAPALPSTPAAPALPSASASPDDTAAAPLAADASVGLTHAGTGAALGSEGIASPSLAVGLADHPLTGRGALEAGLVLTPATVRPAASPRTGATSATPGLGQAPPAAIAPRSASALPGDTAAAPLDGTATLLPRAVPPDAPPHAFLPACFPRSFGGNGDSDSIRIACWNVNGVGVIGESKPPRLYRVISSICYEQRLDALVLTEIAFFQPAPGGRHANGWVLPFNPPPGYTVYLFGRPGGDGRVGGGLAIFVRNSSAEFHERAAPLAAATDAHHYGAIGAVIASIRGVRVVVAGVYLPPDSSHHQAASGAAISALLPQLLSFAQERKALFLGCGDINCDFITTTLALPGDNALPGFYDHFSNTSRRPYDVRCRSGRLFADWALTHRLVMLTGLRAPAQSSRDTPPSAPGEPVQGHVIDVFFTVDPLQRYFSRADTCTAFRLSPACLHAGHLLRLSDHKLIYAELDLKAVVEGDGDSYTPPVAGSRYPKDLAGVRAALVEGRRVRLLRHPSHGMLALGHPHVRETLQFRFCERLRNLALPPVDVSVSDQPATALGILHNPPSSPSQALVDAFTLELVVAAHGAYADATADVSAASIFSADYFAKPLPMDLRACTCAECTTATAYLAAWDGDPTRVADAQRHANVLTTCYERRRAALAASVASDIRANNLKGVLSRMEGSAVPAGAATQAPYSMRASATSTDVVTETGAKRELLVTGVLGSQIRPALPPLVSTGVVDFPAATARAPAAGQAHILRTGGRITPDEVAAALARIPSNVSPGLLGLDREYLSALGDVAARSLWVLCTWLWDDRLVSTNLVLASFVAIIPKPNKATYDLDKSFRNISALAVPPKVMGHVTAQRLLSFLTAARLLHPGVYGAPRRSTQQMVAALVLTERIRSARGLHTHFLKLDMESAYPSVCRTAMVKLLRELGVPDAICAAVATLLRPGSYYITTPFGPHGLAMHWSGLKQGCPLSCVLIVIIGCLVLWAVMQAGTQHACKVPSLFGVGAAPLICIHSVWGFIYVDDLVKPTAGIASASSTAAYEEVAGAPIRPLRMRFEREGGKWSKQQISSVHPPHHPPPEAYCKEQEYVGVLFGPNSSLAPQLARNTTTARKDLDGLRRKGLLGKKTIPTVQQVTVLRLSFHAHAWNGLQAACLHDCRAGLQALHGVQREALSVALGWVHRDPDKESHQHFYRDARSVFLAVLCNDPPPELQFRYRQALFGLSLLRTATAPGDLTDAHILARHVWKATHAKATGKTDVADMPETFISDVYATARAARLDGGVLNGSNVPGKAALKPTLRDHVLSLFTTWVGAELRELPAACWARRMGMARLLRPRPYLARADLVTRAEWGLPIYTQLMCYGTPLAIAKEDMAKERPSCRACEHKGYRPRCTPGHIFFTCDEERHVAARATLFAVIDANLPAQSPGRAWLEAYLGPPNDDDAAENARLDRFAAVILDSDSAFEHRKARCGQRAEAAFHTVHAAAILFLQAVCEVHVEHLRRAGQRYTARRSGPPNEAPPPDAEVDEAADDDDDEALPGQPQGAAGGNAQPEAHPAPPEAHYAADMLELLGDGVADDGGAEPDDLDPSTA